MKLSDLDLDREESNRSAPKDRVPMIKELFELVLNREPSSRELSFYKYGIQNKEEIIEKLLKDDEHKEALEKSKELPELNERVKNAEHKVNQLKQQIDDQQEEINQTRNLLDEKNKEIAILRREKEDPYNFTHAEALKYIKRLTENSRTEINTLSQQDPTESHFSTINSNTVQKKTFIERIYEIIKPN